MASLRFIPRQAFPHLDSLPRSYFLGHHMAGLDKMKSMISSVDLVIECRDYRIPLTSANPLFESSLQQKNRLIVYTKKDLGSNGRPSDLKRESRLAEILAPSSVLFSDFRNRKDVAKILNQAQLHSLRSLSIVGTRMMVVGMPNVGKSTLINALRNLGTGRGKAVRTGNQPGITRKIGSAVKILDPDQNGFGGLYLLDTPGVFMPYVSDPYAMLKLALCGSVKDTVLPPVTMADYLLYHMNLVEPGLYEPYCPPTNDINDLLTAISTKSGRLQKGGEPDLESAALWLIQRWRTGNFGRFVLDDDSGSLEDLRAASTIQAHSLDKPSFRQARVLERVSRGRKAQNDD